MPQVSVQPPNTSSGDERKLLRAAESLLRQLVNDEPFRAAVLGCKFGSRRHRSDKGQERMTNAAVVDIIVTGKESDEGSGDGAIEMTVKLATLGAKVFGEVQPPDPTIALDKAFLRRCVAAGDHVALAAVLLHEWMHVAGFQHPGGGRRDDVPWKVGELAEQFGRAAVPAPTRSTSVLLATETTVATDGVSRAVVENRVTAVRAVVPVAVNLQEFECCSCGTEPAPEPHAPRRRRGPVRKTGTPL